MIRAEGLHKTFPKSKTPVIDGVSLVIEKGDFVSMVGRSGSGKSTLLYLLSTLDRGFTGDIFYDDRSVKAMDVEEIHRVRNRQIGFVFQFHYLLSELTAIENILLPTRKAFGPLEKLDFGRRLLKEVGLEGKEDSFPGDLSGGEQQRVAVARALVMQPDYVFADEPTGNLDSVSGEKVMQLFRNFNREFGTTIVYVTHDQQFASLASRQIRLAEGRIEI
jgi:ABC-type lipoprotein export system ATPase subunit